MLAPRCCCASGYAPPGPSSDYDRQPRGTGVVEVVARVTSWPGCEGARRGDASIPQSTHGSEGHGPSARDSQSC